MAFINEKKLHRDLLDSLKGTEFEGLITEQDLNKANIGFGGSDMAKFETLKASKIQEQAAAQSAESLNPFAQFGKQNIGAAQELLDNPMSYLESNPMFQAALGNSNEQLKRMAAVQGKVGTGGMANQLFQNYLGQGEQFINNQYNRLLSPINMGQSATMGQGNLMLQQAQARAGGITDMANIDLARSAQRSGMQSNFINNAFQLGGMAMNPNSIFRQSA
jgi:hypothetical protein